ncbi:MAG: 16S rRNA (adenine(1518)-N(6)/adenine(1519)-N(6))-dimethyltransferase RsmA [Candidatus Kaiserbacteria bacterium]|nr:16S rRNA (adenine(1518)-N(6)/adenine(1519)-N(6))-dimethyltransferase RsmA [Candidatus Kaiserbacteria bacterium]
MQKKLGQYFLRSRGVLRAVVAALDVPSSVVAVEVGPGKGALTECILDRYDSVIAIEKDVALVQVLQERFADVLSGGQLTLITGDVRDGAWLSLVQGRSYVVIANIPYYLTGSLIRNMLTDTHPPVAMSLVVQKEVAERITRRKGGKESLLSLSVRLFGVARYVQTVPRKMFSPQPRVDSAIITITAIQQPSLQVQDTFFAIIRTAFQEKRKTVLKKFADAPDVHAALAQCGVSSRDRAEDISFETWYRVACLVV